MATQGKTGRGCGLDAFITPMGKPTTNPSNAKTSYDKAPFTTPKAPGGPPLKIMDTAPGEKAAPIRTTMQPLPAKGIKK